MLAQSWLSVPPAPGWIVNIASWISCLFPKINFSSKSLIDGGFIKGDCITVTGKTIGENHLDVIFPTNQDVVYKCNNPISENSSVVGLWGNLAEDGCISKIAGLKNLSFKGKAKCFDSEDENLSLSVTKSIRIIYVSNKYKKLKL